jgi:hypothetical protein
MGHRIDERAGRVVIKRMFIVVFAATVLTVPALAVAARPKAGGVYGGGLPETSARVSKQVTVRVNSTKKTGRATLKCGSDRAPTRSSEFAIATDGSFDAVNKTGSLVVWRVKGRFASGDKARVRLSLPAGCDGKGGKLILRLQ